MRWILPRFMVLLVLFCLPLCSTAFGGENLRVQGIVHDRKNPKETLAVVNGVPLKAGDTIQGYTVKEIRETKVLFVNSGGQEKEVSLLANKAPAAAKEMAVPAAAESAPPVKAAPETSGPKSLKDFLPADLLSRFSSVGVMIDLKNIHLAVRLEYSETGDLPTLADLTAKGKLNPIFENGVKGNYAYSVSLGDRGDPVIFADPIEGHPELPHYMLDEWGNFRKEQDKRASSKSPLASDTLS